MKFRSWNGIRTAAKTEQIMSNNYVTLQLEQLTRYQMDERAGLERSLGTKIRTLDNRKCAHQNNEADAPTATL